MSILAHDPDVIRRHARLTRAEYHADAMERSGRAMLAELDDAGVDRDKVELGRSVLRTLARFAEDEIEAKKGEG